MLRSPLIRAAMLAARPFYGGIGAIHVLHRVIPEPERARLDNRALEITPEDLDAMLHWMKERSYDFITLDELPRRLGPPRGRKFVCFTFDDGYRDNFHHALPVFERHGVPFAVNITTAFTDRTAFAWWYALEEVLCAREEFVFRIAGRRHGFAVGTRAEKIEAFEAISQRIRSCDLQGHQELIEAIFEEAPGQAVEHARELIMDWDEVARLGAHPLVTIGSHGIHHLTCSALDATELREELGGSKRILEERLGRPVRHLAYPFGGVRAVGPRDFQCARECGYTTAVTTRCANLFPSHAAALNRLPRLGVSGNYVAIPRLERLESGLICARANRWKRVVTD